MGINRKAMREKLIKRTQESYERKDGGISTKYFNAESDLPFWKCEITKDEPHLIDIIPFYAGSNFPQIDKRNPVEKDDEVYVLDLFTHTNVGPAKEMIVCPTKNYGQPCPICDEIDRRINEDNAEWEDYKELAPKRRCAYNIICYDSDKQEKKGIQIWEVSHKYSEKILTALAKNSAARGGGVIAYCDPSKDVGQTISFEVANDTYRTISGHKLLPRNYDISDKIIESTFSLDDHIVLLSYEQIKEKAFRSKPEDEAEEKPERGGRRGRVEESEEEEKPTRGRRGRGEEDDIDDEKLMRKKREEEKEKLECVAGGEFGVDFDQYKNCDDCDIFDECKEESESLAEKKKKPEPKKSEGIRRRR